MLKFVLIFQIIVGSKVYLIITFENSVNNNMIKSVNFKTKSKLSGDSGVLMSPIKLKNMSLFEIIVHTTYSFFFFYGKYKNYMSDFLV